MEANLVKRKDRLDLYNEDGHKIASTLGGCNIKLSLKNCQAIELGYDLDELAEENTSDCDASGCYPEDYFKAGFQKALSILGDKKFSSGQLLNAMDLVWQWMNGEDYGCKTLTEVQDKHIQSLQQTEWEVIVEMEDIIHLKNRRGGLTNMGKPKLDADGCLILKRKL